VRAAEIEFRPGNAAFTLVSSVGSYKLGNGLTTCARLDKLVNRRYRVTIGFLRP
jgi:hypothetical protein